MISDETIQAALISKIKTFTDVSGSSTVKELQYQGDEFSYPAVRLDLESNDMYFDEQRRCLLQKVEFSLYFFSDERSSMECSTIKGKAINNMMLDGFTLGGVRFTDVRLIDNVPAIREDERTWRTQARFQSYINQPV